MSASNIVKSNSINTLVVNAFGGPNSGKSKMTSAIFSELKEWGVSCEIAAEFAKDLVWEERKKTFEDQIYIFGKQFHRIFRLLGKVNVVLTDSPLLFTPIYDAQRRSSLEKLAMEEYSRMWNYNIFFKRTQPYNPVGRNHTEDEAKQVDCDILNMLDINHYPYEVFDGNLSSTNKIVEKILTLLHYDRKLKTIR